MGLGGGGVAGSVILGLDIQEWVKPMCNLVKKRMSLKRDVIKELCFNMFIKPKVLCGMRLMGAIKH